MIKAKHLRKGDTVALIAPASPPFNPGDVEYSVEWLNKLGLKVKVGSNVFKSYSDLAGTDDERLDDLHNAFEDPEVSAVIPVRGGNGVCRFLPKLDFDLIKENPKIIIGYSDLTGLVNPIYQRCGLVTFHGPLGGSFYRSSYSHFYFQKALMSNKPLGMIVDPIPEQLWKPKYPPPRLVIAEGKAKAPLVGGCITLIKQLLGTPFEIETEGKILFLEDVNEEPHSIDRYLTQLLMAGSLQKAKAIVVGECYQCEPGASGRLRLSLNKSVEKVLRERLGNLGIPVIYGLRLGHGSDQCTLPIGVNATVEAINGKVKFKIEESATI